MNDAEELAELKRLRDAINARIERLEKLRALNGNRNGGIPSASIRPYITDWIDRGHKLQTLADKADLSVSTLYLILRGEQETVLETTADKILSALGIPQVYQMVLPEEPVSKYYEE